MEKAEREADVIEEALFASCVATAVPAGEHVGPSGFKIFLERFLEQAGNPTDPIERLLIQQLCLAHFRTAQLHAAAERSDSLEGAKLYSAAATRLMGELRRLGLAIKDYRLPKSSKHFSVIKQQNNVGNGTQQVAYLDQVPEKNEAPFSDDNKLGSNRRLSHAPTAPFAAQSETSRRREKEPEEARTSHTRRP